MLLAGIQLMVSLAILWIPILVFGMGSPYTVISGIGSAAALITTLIFVPVFGIDLKTSAAICAVAIFAVIVAGVNIDNVPETDAEGSAYSSDHICVAVMYTNPIEDLSEAAGADFMSFAVLSTEKTNNSDIVALLSEYYENVLEPKEYNILPNFVNDFYKNENAVIIFSETLIPTIEEIHPGFSDDIRILMTYEKKEKIEEESTQTSSETTTAEESPETEESPEVTETTVYIPAPVYHWEEIPPAAREEETAGYQTGEGSETTPEETTEEETAEKESETETEAETETTTAEETDGTTETETEISEQVDGEETAGGDETEESETEEEQA